MGTSANPNLMIKGRKVRLQASSFQLKIGISILLNPFRKALAGLYFSFLQSTELTLQLKVASNWERQRVIKLVLRAVMYEIRYLQSV